MGGGGQKIAKYHVLFAWPLLQKFTSDFLHRLRIDASAVRQKCNTSSKKIDEGINPIFYL